MDLVRWNRVNEIFAEVLTLAPVERARMLAERCAGDAGLQADVEALLHADLQAGSFLKTPAAAAEKLDLAAPHIERAIGIEPDCREFVEASPVFRPVLTQPAMAAVLRDK